MRDDVTGHGFGHIIIRFGVPMRDSFKAGDASNVYTLLEPLPTCLRPAAAAAQAMLADIDIDIDMDIDSPAGDATDEGDAKGVPLGEQFGLVPPWDNDPKALIGAEILANSKGRGAAFRELKDRAIFCSCSSGTQRRMARTFVGADDDGVIRTWLVAMAHGGGGGIPAMGINLPSTPGEFTQPLLAQCPKCSRALVLVSCAVELGRLHIVRVETPTYGTIRD